MKTSTSISKYLLTITSIFLLIFLWFLISTIKDNELIFPKVSSLVIQCGKLLVNKQFLLSLLYSFLRLIAVLFISILISLLIGFVYVLYSPSIYIFKPILALMKAAPLAIVAVYIWIATGGVKGPYIITFLAICPLCVEGVITALEQIDQRIYYELKLTKVNIFKKFIYIFVPLITPYLFMAVLQSFGLGIKVLVMSEYICQSKNSLGQLIYNYKTNLDFTSLLSILIIIVLIVVIIEMLINHFKNKFKFN